jgi:hypothetical protein
MVPASGAAEVLAMLTGSRTVELVVAPADGEAMVGSKAMAELRVCTRGRCDGDGLAGDFDDLRFELLEPLGGIMN